MRRVMVLVTVAALSVSRAEAQNPRTITDVMDMAHHGAVMMRAARLAHACGIWSDGMFLRHYEAVRRGWGFIAHIYEGPADQRLHVAGILAGADQIADRAAILEHRAYGEAACATMRTPEARVVLLRITPRDPQ